MGGSSCFTYARSFWGAGSGCIIGGSFVDGSSLRSITAAIVPLRGGNFISLITVSPFAFELLRECVIEDPAGELDDSKSPPEGSALSPSASPSVSLASSALRRLLLPRRLWPAM